MGVGALNYNIQISSESRRRRPCTVVDSRVPRRRFQSLQQRLLHSSPAVQEPLHPGLTGTVTPASHNVLFFFMLFKIRPKLLGSGVCVRLDHRLYFDFVTGGKLTPATISPPQRSREKERQKGETHRSDAEVSPGTRLLKSPKSSKLLFSRTRACTSAVEAGRSVASLTLLRLLLLLLLLLIVRGRCRRLLRGRGSDSLSRLGSLAAQILRSQIPGETNFKLCSREKNKRNYQKGGLILHLPFP